MARIRQSVVLWILALALWPRPAPAQNAGEVQIETLKLADGVYMLIGAGGNIGVSAGDDGVVLIDDQMAPLTDKIKAAVSEITDRPIRFVLNTHWHGDHTGGNENLGKAGAVIVAHDNVRERMSVEQLIEAFNRKVPASPKGALPVITFSDTLTFHLNGGEISAFHVPPAHTDGDSMVHFPEANVLHMGDTFFNGRYPFIDVSSGGSIDGMIEATEAALVLVDSETKIIPGHGPPGDREALVAYREMLQLVRDRIAPMVEAGTSVDEVVAAKPTADLDETWGQGFLNGDAFVRMVYDSLAR